MKKPSGTLALLAATITTIAFAATTVLAMSAQAPGGATAAEGARTGSGALQWALLSAALAVGLGSLGAGYAVARVGSAAVGALAEKPELMGRVLILVGLAEGIAIYGLIVAILILNRVA